MEEIKIAFIHELGHFVAHTLNKTIFGRPAVRDFEIYRCKQNADKWCGHVTPGLPDDSFQNNHKPPPIGRLHFVLASVMYGCLFQSYYCRTNLKLCYQYSGFHDSRKWIDFLYANGLSDRNNEFAEIEEDYLRKLTDLNSLDSFMEINPFDILTSKSTNEYSANVLELEERLSGQIESHSDSYKSLVERYKGLILDIR